MKVRRVNRYYCDFCKRGRCSKHAIATHEIHCCRNPNRVCRMCLRAELEQQPIADLVSSVSVAIECGSGEDCTEYAIGDIAATRTLANGCPACILAAILQHPQKPSAPFDFKAESESFLADLSERIYQCP